MASLIVQKCSADKVITALQLPAVSKKYYVVKFKIRTGNDNPRVGCARATPGIAPAHANTTHINKIVTHTNDGY